MVKGEKVGVKFLDPGKKLKRKKTRLSAKKAAKRVLKKTAKKDDIPPVPPTPDIPESMKSTITRSGLKFLQRMRSQPEIQSRGSNGSKYAQFAAVFANGNKAKSTTKLVKQPVRSASSQDQARDSFYHRTSSLPDRTSSLADSNVRSSQYSLYSQPNFRTQSAENTATMGQRASAIVQGEGSSPRTPLPKPDVKYDICEPRLSTMEYTRLYLVEEANAKKEKRLCELPPPKKVWLWGPRWEEFLVLPKIPSTIRRRFSLDFDEEEKKSMSFIALDGDYDSDADSIETVKGMGSVSANPPRLSLNLETMASTLSSLMNLASLGSDGATQALARAQPAGMTEVARPESPILGSMAFANVKQNW